MRENDIKNIFKKHWEYYSNQGAGILDTIHNLQGKIRQEYAGRVIYELLQNAFDTKPDQIIVDIVEIEEKKYLIVGNGGESFSFEKNFDYNTKIPTNNFNSLCSISDSNKKFTESIGNKGIGFRSVFQVNKNIEDKVAFILIQESKESSKIGFKLYDTAIQEIIENDDLYKDIESNLEKTAQIKALEDGKISGYCYPLIMEGDDIDQFKSYLDGNKIKTLIVVPLDQEAHDKISQNYIEKIKKIHFSFVHLKYNKKINIDIFKQKREVSEDNNLSHSNIIMNEDIKKLAKNLNLYENKKDFKLNVGCYYNSEKNYIYNYLPTEIVSPFKCMDINSDFLTSINRETMNLKKDEDEDEGKYNLILLRASIELHFLTLSTYLDDCFDFKKGLNFINSCQIQKINFNKDKFWKYFQLNGATVKEQTKEIIKEIFGNNGENIGEFIAKLAKKYFEQDNLTIENFDDFWKVIFQYTHIFSGVQGKYTNTYNNKLNEIISKTKDTECVYISENNKTNFTNTIYYTEKENNIVLPNIIKAKTTTYKFADYIEVLKNTKYIKKFDDYGYNELLKKHFRQIPRSGNYTDENKIEPSEQKEILQSLFSIYLAKNRPSFSTTPSLSTTHRYAVLISDDKDYTKISAYFAISTIFLKINDEKYRPAQYCFVDDVKKFIDFEIPNNKKDKSIDEFLRFLGVSFDKNIRYTDFEDNNLFNGLDYIPALYQKDDDEKKDTTPYIENMRIYYLSDKWDCKHPAFFYKTSAHNPILTEIKSTKYEIKDKESISLVVKKLKDYPKGYIKQVLSKLQEPIKFDENTVFKIYSEIFKNYKEKYLIYNKERIFQWKEECNFQDLVIAKTKKDFGVLKNKVDILATFSDVAEDAKLKQYQANIEYKMDSNGIKDNTNKSKLESKIIDILLLISQSDLSKYDFREDEDNESLTKFNNRWVELSFYRLDEINPKIILNDLEIEEKIERINDPIKIKKNVYFTNTHKLSDFSDMLSEFFKVSKLRDSIKLILLDEKQDVNREDIGIIASKWLKIDDNKQQSIIKELKDIRFQKEITFRLNYTQDDFDCEYYKDETEDTIQKKINDIIKSEQFEIDFDCKTKNQILLNRIKNKYSEILDNYPIHNEDILLKKVCLSENNIFISMGKTEEYLNTKLNELLDKNLVKDYDINSELPKKEEGTLQTTNDNAIKTSSVGINKNRKKVESNRMAKRRGLKIEVLLVKDLALKYENEKKKIIELAGEIYEKIKEETLENGDKRFILNNATDYSKTLENGSLEEILHISKKLGDGVGFDILFPNEDKNGVLELLKVEVKSSEAGETIYLSENERKQILLFEAKKDTKEDESFRIFIYKKNNSKKDITDLVFNILKQNNDFSNIKAETWILDIGTEELNK